MSRLGLAAAGPLVLVLFAGCLSGKGPFGEACVPTLEPDVGAFGGQWTRPVTVGTQEREWQPAPLHWADAEHLARLDTLSLSLEWTNTPQGSADFGIAIGRDGDFQYWNSEFQTSLGSQSETLGFDRTQLEANGWTSGDHLDAGPSVSTGAYSATSPVPYTLSWAATFQPPAAGEACDPGTDRTDDSAAAQAPGRQA